MKPGGFARLLRHEVRLALRGTGKARWFARAAPRLLLAAVPMVGGIGLAVLLAHAGGGDLGGEAAPGLVGAAVVALFVLMLSTAAIAVQRTFVDRADLDLLLAAPVPPARVLAAKAVGVAVGVALPFIVLFAPFALAYAVLGHPRLLGSVAIIGVDAVLATATAIVVVAGLRRALGPRPARLAVQLGAAVLGGLVFLASQAPSLAPKFAERAFDALDAPWPAPLDWPARAALGEPLRLAALVAVAGAAGWAAAGIGARALTATGAESGGRAHARTTTVRFHTGLTRIVVAKELRLIARDPELISQVALRLIYLIPLAALLARGGEPGPAIAAGATGFAGLLASSLAWITVAAEDAPDLLAAAPRPAATIARAKLIAATVVPVAVVAGVALATAAAGRGRRG